MQTALILVLLVISHSTVRVYAQDETVDDKPKVTEVKEPGKPKANTWVDFILSNRRTEKLSYDDDNEKWLANFDSSCRTVYIIPGYLTGRLALFDELIEEYLRIDECHNVVYCDWPESYDPDYILAAQSVYDAGAYIGQHIIDLYGKALILGNIEVVGSGLGAHVAGCAGKTTYNVIPLDVIYGLDPAGDLFTDGYTAFLDFRLTSGDASKVCCLHTNTNGIGTSKECGKYDFYANSGAKQPGIIFEHNGYYSHMRAVYYHKEALRSEAFVAHGPLGFPTTRYGRSMQKSVPAGKYYFKTNTKEPYGRG